MSLTITLAAGMLAAPAPAAVRPAPAPVERSAEGPIEGPADPALGPAIPPPPPPVDEATTLVIVGADSDAPPYADDADRAALRQRFGLSAAAEAPPPPVRWRCWIADPTCGFNVEVNATSAYAYRLRQGSVSDPTVLDWHSARVQYDLWLNIPAAVETRGAARYTRLTLGPKGGVIASDDRSFWGNIGVASRYWLGRGRYAPTIEFSGALTFALYGANRTDTGTTYQSRRSPLGFTADVGFGIGGFGALIVGGQFDSPLARTDISDAFKIASSGMFFVGFRGNILWGAPAVAAAGTHAAVLRAVTPP